MSDEPLAPMPNLRAAQDGELPVIGMPRPDPTDRCVNVYVCPADDGGFKYELHVPPCENYPSAYTGMGQFNSTNPYDIVAFVDPSHFTSERVDHLPGEMVIDIANALLNEMFDITCTCCSIVRDNLRGGT